MALTKAVKLLKDSNTTRPAYPFYFVFPRQTRGAAPPWLSRPSGAASRGRAVVVGRLRRDKGQK
ncbi:hypothetical protein CCACVL1_21652 [Corchorus capsularis]|uniref:Uncharacterized protein n=1 Tax=Corchorus capsularis TaxID=210143 RepID=A0A1R3H2L8_COCAP|nr:hypothetical protein CCACVL1_21652 [Corchorus capsularis]